MRQAASAIQFPSTGQFQLLLASLLIALLALAAAPSRADSLSAAIVVDARTGRTLYESNADALRYPASLTKMMTLYLTFEALKSGRISKTTRVPFSAQASAMPPTKLGVKPGNSVTVETVIFALVTKSANDAAAAMGELLGGSEAAFARMMTDKARRLGMRSTTFRNASGLPNDEQRTTARDMATLGVALREHFPEYYGYFSTRSFMLGKQRIAGHNRLLGRIKGVDGIKTGYIRASGYNLVSSVKVDGRSIVGVVMGGKSGASRDAQMARLIQAYLPKAATRGDGALVAQAGDRSTVDALAGLALPKNAAPMPDERPAILVAETEEDVRMAEAEQMQSVPAYAPVARVAAIQQKPQVESAPKAAAAPRPKMAIDPISTASTAPSGWAVQVASSPSESEARGFLDATKKAAAVLAKADPYTIPFNNDGTTYYRARFGGFASKTAAWNACGALKKKKIACYAVQQ